ncbi:YkoF family thiamine/hydroxymethylpyrimidine-binding protein [Aliikangiella sp. IMCC44653]
MRISLELSLYPLSDDFLSIIKEVVEMLNAQSDVECVTNSMSTQVFGEYDAVMSLLNKVVRFSFEKYGKQVFVAKFLNGDVAASRVVE